MDTPLSRKASREASHSRMTEWRSGMVVLGACGLFPSDINLINGRKRASNVYAVCVCFCRSKFHVALNLWIYLNFRNQIKLKLIQYSYNVWVRWMLLMLYLRHAQSQQQSGKAVHVAQSRFAFDCNFNPAVQHGRALLNRRANQNRHSHK